VKRLLAMGLLCVGLAGAQAAPLNIVNVGAGIDCLFNTNCADTAIESTSPITLPGTTGSGFLQTRIITGGSNAPAAGLFGYEYRIDLTGITGATNTEPCVTNLVRSITNRVVTFTNVVEIERRTNAAGKVRVKNRSERVPVATNLVVTSVTNTIPCPGTAACIESLSINFRGLVSTLNLDTNSATITDQVYVVTSGGLGTVAPTSVTQSNGTVTFHFTNAICPGESSLFVGLVSSNPPTNVRATLDLTSGPNLTVAALGPGRLLQPIPCNFNILETLIGNLEASDIQAPNVHAQRGRLKSIANRLEALQRAAEEGDVEATLEGLASIANKIGEGQNAWINGQAGQMITGAIEDLLDCIQEFEEGQADQ
jgi:hypothetical protein